uniref:Uncharacterized protein n=1 Tax=viral metagenome TaxID=1070528 RepID=A0A6C0AJQ7_9ZZZZ
MEAFTYTGVIFACLTVGSLVIMMATTFSKCGKTNFLVSLKNGAITAAAPSLMYLLASFLTVIREPFKNFFVSLGLNEDTALKVGIGYILMLVLWPMTVWTVHDSETKVCVATADEMSKFKTDLLAKLNAKKHADAAASAPVVPPPTA